MFLLRLPLEPWMYVILLVFPSKNRGNFHSISRHSQSFAPAANDRNISASFTFTSVLYIAELISNEREWEFVRQFFWYLHRINTKQHSDSHRAKAFSSLRVARKSESRPSQWDFPQSLSVRRKDKEPSRRRAKHRTLHFTLSSFSLVSVEFFFVKRERGKGSDISVTTERLSQPLTASSSTEKWSRK